MGCKASKSFDIIIEFEGRKKQMTGNLPKFEALNQWIFAEFPQLNGRAVSLKVNSIPLKTEQELNYLAKKNDLIKIALEKVKSSVETNVGIVKFGSEKQKVVGTGFLLNKEYVVVCKSLWNSVKSENLQVILPNDCEIRVKSGVEPIKLSDFFVALPLGSQILDYECILLNQTHSYVEDQVGTVFFYTQKLPVLQKYTGKFVYKEGLFESSLALESGAVGSPVIASDNKLLGIYIDEKHVFSAALIMSDVKMNIELYQDSLCDSFATDPDIIHETLQMTTAYVDSKRSKLIYYSPSEAIKKSHNNFQMAFGSVAISTPHGILITGLSTKNESTAYILINNTLHPLPPPLKPHIHHSAVFFHDEFFAISGPTPSVDIFNFKQKKWSPGPSLNKSRSYSSSISSAGQIFVFGGRRDTKILSSILSYKNEIWTKLGIKLPIGIMNLGCIDLKNEILLFGGEGEGGKNKGLLRFNTSHLQIDVENCFVCHNFGRASGFYDENEVVIFSNDGALFRFDKGKQMFLMLCVDEEEVEGSNNY